MAGARAVQQSVLSDFPHADISVSIVWIQIPSFSDDKKAAAKMAATFDDSRVRHFYDPFPVHRAGRGFAEGLIAEGRGPAWDIYLFYKPGLVWDDAPPAPSAYLHQLSGGQRADAQYFATGDDLIERLHELVHATASASCRNARHAAADR